MKQKVNNQSIKSDKEAGSKNKKRYFLAGLGIIATTVLTFFGIYYWRKHKTTQASDSNAPDFKAQKPDTAKGQGTSRPKTKSNSQNPSKSTIQFNDSKAKETTEEPSLFEPKDLANKIRSSILQANFILAYTSLKQIRHIKDYSNVNAEFVKMKTGFSSQTIVNGLLGKFKLESQRKLLFIAFKRIGLKYNGTKWTLGDTGQLLPQLITTTPTKVWKDPRTNVSVPSNMVLGREVCKRGNFTLFEHAKNYFLVESKAVKTIHS